MNVKLCHTEERTYISGTVKPLSIMPICIIFLWVLFISFG